MICDLWFLFVTGSGRAAVPLFTVFCLRSVIDVKPGILIKMCIWSFCVEENLVIVDHCDTKSKAINAAKNTQFKTAM